MIDLSRQIKELSSFHYGEHLIGVNKETTRLERITA